MLYIHLIKGVCPPMRKIIAFILILLLLPLPLALAEGDSASTPEPTATPMPSRDQWSKQSLPYKRLPEPIEVIHWDDLPPVIDGQHHYLLLCIDQWNRDPRPDGAKPPTGIGGHRRDMYGNTDGIVLVTLDTRAHRVMLTSFIRDAIVRKPTCTDEDQRFTRINYVYNDFGPEELCRTISEHIGVRVEKYILFTFNQIASIVDYLGGVDVNLRYYEIDYLRRYAVPWGSVKDERGRDLRASGNHPEGTYHFKGHSAVLYMRIRKAGGGGDFQRTQRVRTVLSTLADKCKEMTMDDAKALANNVLEHSNKTNMNMDEMIQAAEQAFALRGCTIEELRIPQDQAVRRINFAEMATQELNWYFCREDMNNYLQNSWLVLDDDDE